MPASLLLPIVLVLAAGSMMAIQPPTNAYLARASGSVMFAALLSFLVGTIVLTALTLATQRPALAPLRDVPWYAWAGGLTALSSSRSQPMLRRALALPRCSPWRSPDR